MPGQLTGQDEAIAHAVRQLIKDVTAKALGKTFKREVASATKYVRCTAVVVSETMTRLLRGDVCIFGAENRIGMSRNMPLEEEDEAFLLLDTKAATMIEEKEFREAWSNGLQRLQLEEPAKDVPHNG